MNICPEMEVSLSFPFVFFWFITDFWNLESTWGIYDAIGS